MRFFGRTYGPEADDLPYWVAITFTKPLLDRIMEAGRGVAIEDNSPDFYPPQAFPEEGESEEGDWVGWDYSDKQYCDPLPVSSVLLHIDEEGNIYWTAFSRSTVPTSTGKLPYKTIYGMHRLLNEYQEDDWE